VPNWKLIIKILGFLLFIEAGLLALCLPVSLAYDESVMPFLWTICTALVLGMAGVGVGVRAKSSMSRKDGYIVVSVVWILFSLIGMLPFLIDGCIPDVPGAFFEAVSGFTSTGSTVIDNVDSV
jgi:trk system potassium uptake protein TrkH